MANQEQLDILKQGGKVWNQWRAEHPDIRPDFSRANLPDANLSGANLSYATLTNANLSYATLTNANLSYATLTNANLSGADLSEAIFSQANLLQADLSGANLSRAYLGNATLTSANLSQVTLTSAILDDANLSYANLSGANLSHALVSYTYLIGADLTSADLSEAIFLQANLLQANLLGANLSGANLSGANLSRANLSRADLSEANLERAVLVDTNLTGATLTQCSIYGISAWNVELTGALQNSLIITSGNEPQITVDNLKIAQFIYLLLNNEEIREVIDTITSKVVLILGRFTPERKAVLDALRDELRKRNYSPIVFDFEIPGSRDITETVSLLARMARFVIADLTDAKSIPQELSVIIPDLPSVPVQPLLQTAEKAYSMFEHWMRYSSVLDIYYYTGKLGQICTNFEVKHRKSARIVRIDHSEPGETAPHLVYFS